VLEWHGNTLKHTIEDPTEQEELEGS
jgi:hypothetical protein